MRRSKGYEGMAASKDGSKLYAMLEGALWPELLDPLMNRPPRKRDRFIEYVMEHILHLLWGRWMVADSLQ